MMQKLDFEAKQHPLRGSAQNHKGWRLQHFAKPADERAAVPGRTPWRSGSISSPSLDDLEGLDRGDAISVSGEFHVESYEWGGSVRLAFKMAADRLISLKPAWTRRRRTAC